MVYVLQPKKSLIFSFPQSKTDNIPLSLPKLRRNHNEIERVEPLEFTRRVHVLEISYQLC